MTTATQEISVAPISTNSAKEFNDQAISLASKITKLVVKDQESYESAASYLKSVKDIGKIAEEARKKITTPLDQAKTAVMDLFRPTATALDNLERHLKGLMISYSNEQERIRAEQEAKLRRQAEAEEKRKREALEERARKALEAGKTEKAEELTQQAAEVFVPAPILAPTIQKVSGVSMRKNWKARIVNEALVPRDYLMVDVSKLDKMAKATQGSLQISGVQFYAEDVMSSR